MVLRFSGGICNKTAAASKEIELKSDFKYESIYLECCAVRFADGGRKVVVLTSGDGGIETYDLETWEKWRFARPGVDLGFEEEIKSNESDKNIDQGQQKEKAKNVLDHGGYSMTVWDPKGGKVWFASMDGDAVRIWDLPMKKEC